jgi:hypothetical protein
MTRAELAHTFVRRADIRFGSEADTADITEGSTKIRSYFEIGR